MSIEEEKQKLKNSLRYEKNSYSWAGFTMKEMDEMLNAAASLAAMCSLDLNTIEGGGKPMIKRIKCRISESSESKKKLKNIPRGETFSRFGHEWIVLEHDNTNRTLVLLNDIIGKMPFDKNNCNNWAKSTLRKYLNGEFLKEMCLGEMCVGLTLENLGFFSFKTDLTSDDGLKDYGEFRDVVSLLTCDLYRKHRDILEPIDKYWWLATPYSPVSANNGYVCYVNMSGSLSSSGACSWNGGVRPLCCLSSDVLVNGQGFSNA